MQRRVGAGLLRELREPQRSAVLFEPVPGITFTRPATVSTTKAITRSCSSWLSVGDSPVVPTGTRQPVPAAIWNSICSRNLP